MQCWWVEGIAVLVGRGYCTVCVVFPSRWTVSEEVKQKMVRGHCSVCAVFLSSERVIARVDMRVEGIAVFVLSSRLLNV